MKSPYVRLSILHAENLFGRWLGALFALYIESCFLATGKLLLVGAFPRATDQSFAPSAEYDILRGNMEINLPTMFFHSSKRFSVLRRIVVANLLQISYHHDTKKHPCI